MSSKSLAIDDYLVDQTGVDWSSILATWHWLLPAEFTLWLVNRIGDLFIVLADGSVHMLDIGGGTLTKVAESREDFGRLIDEGDNANDWLAIPIVNQLVVAGMTLLPGQCYAFKQLPILGGDYVIENFGPLSVADWLSACGSIHEQLRDVPNGTRVMLNVTNLPQAKFP